MGRNVRRRKAAKDYRRGYQAGLENRRVAEGQAFHPSMAYQNGMNDGWAERSRKRIEGSAAATVAGE